jgi:hypothetical protein
MTSRLCSTPSPDHGSLGTSLSHFSLHSSSLILSSINLTKLKTFAPAARTAFIAAVSRRAGTLGILPDRVEPVTESGDVALIGGQPFSRSVVPLRKQLVETIQRDGFAPTMEAMAYTWFNRLVALRFMELHDGYLDHGHSVLSHPEGGGVLEDDLDGLKFGC